MLHHVKYTVFSETPFRNAEIYYRDVDPPNFADYSHNPYVFSPNVEADVGPNQMWTHGRHAGRTRTSGPW